MERSEGEIVSDSKSEERHWKKVPFPGMYVNKCIFSYECSLLLRLVERDKQQGWQLDCLVGHGT